MRRAALLILVLIPAAVVRADDAADRAAITQQARRFSAAYMANDVETLLGIYTADAVIAPTGGEFLQGTEALRGYWSRPERSIVTHHEIVPVAVEISGDTAYDYGHYRISGADRTAEGEKPWGPRRGKYLAVWKRGGDGVWRMAVDMWNSAPSREADD